MVGMTGRLLGGHVRRRPHDGACLCLAAVPVHLPGQAEIRNLGGAIDRQQNIGGFQIAMHHVAAMRQMHRPRQRFH